MYIDGVGEVTQGYYDIHVIPDKHNTGCDESVGLTPAVGESFVVENGPYLRADGNTSIYFDFNDGNNSGLNGTFTIENVDFSRYTNWSGGIGNAWGYNGDGITIRYINCKFGSYNDANTFNRLIKSEFVNCSFLTFGGSNSTFDNCYFGGRGAKNDPIVPNYNCTFNNCYISDIVYKTDTQGGDHIDGMQTLYGQDLYFNNCRWEVPDINYSAKNGGFSYVIFIEPTHGDAENVIFDHCHLNGGGHYSISVAQPNATEHNIRIIEPFIGYCYEGYPYYPTGGNMAEAVTENPRLHDALYVSSVWKDNDGKLHFLVTNDTGEDRTLSVHTNKGVSTFNVPRTYRVTEYEADTKDFNDLPIDIEHIAEADVSYAVFMENNNQIRFVDFGSEEKTYETVNDLFKDICDAIREKTQTSEPIKHTDIPEKIRLL